jgi:membrane protease YdiL (CAAX protease family)
MVCLQSLEGPWMEAKQIEIRTLAISILSVAALEGAMRWLLVYHAMMVLGLTRIFEAVVVVLIAVVWGSGPSSLGLDQDGWLLGFRRGLIWAAGFAFIAFLVVAGLLLAGIHALAFIQTRLPTKPVDIVLFFLVGGIIAPAAEEVFFRGLLFGFLRRWGFPLALILSSLLFVLVHPMHRGIPFTQIVGGLLFALAYEVEGNLLVPITIHALGNLAIFTLSLLI